MMNWAHIMCLKQYRIKQLCVAEAVPPEDLSKFTGMYQMVRKPQRIGNKQEWTLNHYGLCIPALFLWFLQRRSHEERNHLHQKGKEKRWIQIDGQLPCPSTLFLLEVLLWVHRLCLPFDSYAVFEPHHLKTTFVAKCVNVPELPRTLCPYGDVLYEKHLCIVQYFCSDFMSV